MLEVMQHRQMYLNLPVRNLAASVEFFRKLGFEFNKQFTDERAACMVVNDDAFVMLLQDEFFRTFTMREIADTTKYSEAMTAFSCPSRAAVDELAHAALAAGATSAMPPMDMGFMYSRSFYDLDGHHWEPMWMDPNAAQPT
jgi:predicted lactoylglutathione lyase